VRAHPELGHVRLADRNHARPAQPLDEDGVLGRHVVLEDRGAPGEGKPDGGHQVLEGDGKAVQGADRVAAGQAPVGLVGQGQAPLVVQLRDDGVDLRVDPADLLQVRRHHLARGELAVADLARQLATAHEAEFGGARGRGRLRDRARRRRGAGCLEESTSVQLHGRGKVSTGGFDLAAPSPGL
jgi:hypothetical protein